MPQLKKHTKKMSLLFTITQKDFDNTVAQRPNVIPDYVRQELFLNYAVTLCPGFSYNEIMMRAILINQLYGTSIYDISSVAKELFNCVNSIGLVTDIIGGSPDAVGKIVDAAYKATGRINVSFATKFASFYNPSAFPIYDDFVSSVFCGLERNGFFIGRKFSKAKIKSSYSLYKDVYDEFMLLSGMQAICFQGKPLTYKEVDTYLWSSRKVYKAAMGSIPMGKVILSNPGAMIVVNNIINTVCKQYGIK